MLDAAQVYMQRMNHDWEIRFDIIGITLRQGYPPKIRHYEDAFFPEW